MRWRSAEACSGSLPSQNAQTALIARHLAVPFRQVHTCEGESPRLVTLLPHYVHGRERHIRARAQMGPHMDGGTATASALLVAGEPLAGDARPESNARLRRHGTKAEATSILSKGGDVYEDAFGFCHNSSAQ